MKGKSLIGVILAAICVTVTYLLPGSEELSHEGITALGVLGMASILWISNTLPFGVTGLLALVMLVLLGVSDMASVFVGFSNSSVIFVITVFCLTAAVMNTKLTLRLINKLLRWAGSSAEKLVLAYMAAAALLSSVMSNVPVTVLFLGLALYVYAKEQGDFEIAFAIAAILMALTVIINLVATLVGKYYQKRRSI